ncbi:tRNA-dihydrouridine(20a/20b) synthase [NAD(P)+]-like 3 [Homarus americanus]|uniref:tRNA-dihydrouridine(20a/20b) synthase [NAD(P)+]-like 2 n=1 Tax=Homarus americanus TaxID=6706 RepID=A0A8J5KDS4_HOMAM|nr:tRNA-dihydrouridine(20a/20b) synthase [NAD(P)+]-like 2 [Homarus americanus]KAG7170564.1 tRNA-dihydrouridine(20a/20b) synthase [NAD(P)+]-like 3 [Homarus americanus]
MCPMVRYSKLAFRSLVRKYECDLCFTPMIISDCFIQSIRARHSDFTTCKEDALLVVQFSNYCDGVDLNCGCPQRWAMAGAHRPASSTNLTSWRYDTPDPHTVDFARQMEAAGRPSSLFREALRISEVTSVPGSYCRYQECTPDSSSC